MTLNSRQKRTAKRKLALHDLAVIRNAPTVARTGSVRSVWSKVLPPRAHIPFHGRLMLKRKPLRVWGQK